MADSTGEIVVIKRNGSDGSRFPLKGQQCSFGRDPSCNIRIIRTDVEPEHVTLDYGDGKVWLTNLSANNPAMVNEAVVDAKSLLKDKDVFTIGGRSFRFEELLPVVPARRKSSLVKTPLGSYQGSPRTPAARENLKRSITRLEKASDSLVEENEMSSPNVDKENTPCKDATPVAQGLLKRKSIAGSVSKKRVSFGGNLSPELFDKTLPPNTPLRKGSSPAGRRRSEPISTPPARKVLDKKRRSVSVFATSSSMEDVLEEPEVFEEGSGGNDAEECPAELLSVVSNKAEESASISPISDTKTDESRKRMKTPLRKSIERGAKLRPVYRKLATPLRKGIHSGRVLRRTKQSLPLNLKAAIEGGAELRVTKKKIATPLRKAILSKPSLRETKKKMRKSLQSEILQQPKLKVTKKKMRQSLQAEILEPPKLKETKKKMRESLQVEIQNPPQLNETKKKMRKSLQSAIRNPPQLTATKKKMRKSLQVDIQNPPELKETKKKMRKSLQTAIQNPPQLNETKKKMRKSLQASIKTHAPLKETKKKMRKSLQTEIQNPPVLKETKKKMKQSLQAEIKSKPKLKETKRKMRQSLQASIIAKPALKETKKKLATPVRREIESHPKLRPTKRKIATPLKKEIEAGTHLKTLQERYPVLADDVQDEIKTGKKLKQVKADRKKALTTPIRKEIESKPKLKKTLKRLNTPVRADIKKGLKLKSIKDRYPALSTEIQSDIKMKKTLKMTMLSAPTPLRKQIKEGMKLKKTKLVMRSSLQGEIRAGTLLKQTLKKSLKTPIRKQIVEVAKARVKKAVSSPKASKGRKILKARRRLPPRERQVSEAMVDEKPKAKKEKMEPPTKRQRRGSTPRPVKKAVKSPKATDIKEKFTGISRIMKTPKVKAAPVDDVTGFERLVKTPKVKKPEIEDFGGVSRIMKTPKVKNAATTDFAGVARIMKAPRVKNLPSEDFTGVARIMKTPKVKNSPVADLTCVARIMNTPKETVSTTEQSNDVNLAGVRRLLATPKARKDDSESLECLKDLFETPTNAAAKGTAEEDDSHIQPKSSKRATRKTKAAAIKEDINVEPVAVSKAEETDTAPGIISSTRRHRGTTRLTKKEPDEDAKMTNQDEQPSVAKTTSETTNKRKRTDESESVSMKRARKDDTAQAISEETVQASKTRSKRNTTSNRQPATRSARSRRGRSEVVEKELGVIVECKEENELSSQQESEVKVSTPCVEAPEEQTKKSTSTEETIVEKGGEEKDSESSKPSRQTRSNQTGNSQSNTLRNKRGSRKNVKSKDTPDVTSDTKPSGEDTTECILSGSVAVSEEQQIKPTRRTRHTVEVDSSDNDMIKDVVQSVNRGRRTRGQAKVVQIVDEPQRSCPEKDNGAPEDLDIPAKATVRSTKSQTRTTRATRSKPVQIEDAPDNEQRDKISPGIERSTESVSLPTRTRTRKQNLPGSEVEQKQQQCATDSKDEDVVRQPTDFVKPTKGKAKKAPARATRQTRSKVTLADDQPEVKEEGDSVPEVPIVEEDTPVPTRTRSTRGKKAEKVEVPVVATRSSRRTRK